MHFTKLTCLAALCSLALSQSVVNEYSFGHQQPLSPNSFSIPGWSILGEGHVPQILSDKVMMTPPMGGNKRGAMWTEAKNTLAEWTVDVDFRVGGQDRAGGNMQLWYVKDGSSAVSTSSLYTVGRFEGLAILIDTVGGVQKIRGFLNDGNTDYHNHPMIESLAFGHCDYAYRNLGRPSQLQIKYTSSGLAVSIDGTQCFTTPKVTLPTDYVFGATAASADPPDSFEIFKFQTSSAHGQLVQPQGGINTQQQTFGGASTHNDITGSSYTGTQAGTDALRTQLQSLSESVDSLVRELQKSTQAANDRYQEILRKIDSRPTTQGGSNNLGNVESKLSSMERLIQELHRDTKDADHKGSYQKLSAQIEQSHAGIAEHVPNRLREYMISHTPRIGFIAFSFMAFQSCCLAFLLWQKYRKSTMPKKFL